ncbi:hypothetical protein [Streptomyces sp. CS62]|uniref:hypothetical protein n=1 Tax=Streptomyces sp. CS62 TaxID=3119268 RepID=UPI002F935A72
MAVPTAVASKAMRKMTDTMPMLSVRYADERIPPSGGGGITAVGCGSDRPDSRALIAPA